MDDLRYALQERIVQNLDLSSHAAELEEIRRQSPHTIEMVPFQEPLVKCNCVMFALGFRIETPSTVLGRFYANTDYVRSLIDQAYLADIGENPQAGSLAIYLKDAKVEHIGIVCSSGRVLSKWGIGHLYEHEPLDVPVSYGSAVRYFSPIDSDLAFELLEEFHHA